jgi:hypothetical protein
MRTAVPLLSLAIIVIAASCVGVAKGVLFSGVITDLPGPGRMCMNVGSPNQPATICGRLPGSTGSRFHVGECVVAIWAANDPTDTRPFDDTEGTFHQPVKPC